MKAFYILPICSVIGHQIMEISAIFYGTISLTQPAGRRHCSLGRAAYESGSDVSWHIGAESIHRPHWSLSQSCHIFCPIFCLNYTRLYWFILILLFNMDLDPYSLDPTLPEGHEQPPAEPENEFRPLLHVADRQNMSSEQWCTCCCCESRPTHTESICCREIKHILSKITSGPRITMEEDFSALLLTSCVLRHFFDCIRETRGYGIRETEWTNR